MPHPTCTDLIYLEAVFTIMWKSPATGCDQEIITNCRHAWAKYKCRSLHYLNLTLNLTVTITLTLYFDITSSCWRFHIPGPQSHRRGGKNRGGKISTQLCLIKHKLHPAISTKVLFRLFLHCDLRQCDNYSLESYKRCNNVSCMNLSGYVGHVTTGWPKKSKPLPIDQKIVLKPVSEIIFIRQIKVWIKHHNIIRCH